MDTKLSRLHHNLLIAESYYNSMISKDFNRMANFLHDNVHFIGPFAEIKGKNTVVLAAKNFAEVLQKVQIRGRFSEHNQIMFAYDMTVSGPIRKFRAAVLMEFTDQLISKIELFYDARPFIENRDDIFKNSDLI